MIRNIVLVTGGAGFIGSHTCVELLKLDNEKYRVLIVDDLVNSNKESCERVLQITKRREGQDVLFHDIDLKNFEALNSLFHSYAGQIDSVIHFAGLKAVGESVEKPLEYYENNVTGTLHLLRVMRDHNVKKLIFSSSATVYGDPNSVPIKETATLRTTNPYGRTKHMIEDIIRDFTKTDKEFSAAILRYFNPVGAHESGLLGEDPKGIPNNLLPMIMRVAIGKSPFVSIFGSDWPTRDGTGVRDYIHVVDLAKGHISALHYLENHSGCDEFNLGSGVGLSVLELIDLVRKVSGKEIPVKSAGRRPGDIATCYADPTKARDLLGWTATLGPHEMVRDAWNWTTRNPDGVKTTL